MTDDLDSFDPNLPLDQFKFDDPNEELFFAIGWCEQPGVRGDFLAKIEHALTNGADINGFSEDGATPLTDAIEGGMGSPKAVKKLLENGADPSFRDKNGWTPWATCISRLEDNVVKDRMEKIKKLLIDCNADQSDGVLFQVRNAVINRNHEQVKQFIDQNIDLNSPLIYPLHIAVRNLDYKMVKLLLAANINPEGNLTNEDDESCLITAAGLGDLDLVKLLVEAGADVTKYAWGDKRCTADFIAREGGHHDVADWLVQQLPDKIIDERKRMTQSIDPKFKEVHEKRTNGINCDITNDDVIEKLTKWDEQYSINISEIESDRITIHFEDLPDDLESLANEIYEFCPDVIEQGYGCMGEMVEMAEEYGHDIPPETLKLIEGIDFNDESFGLKILQRDLKEKQMIGLWWD